MMHVLLDYILPLFLAWYLHCISSFYAGVYSIQVVMYMYEGRELTFFHKDSRKIMTGIIRSDIPSPPPVWQCLDLPLCYIGSEYNLAIEGLYILLPISLHKIYHYWSGIYFEWGRLCIATCRDNLYPHSTTDENSVYLSCSVSGVVVLSMNTLLYTQGMC